MFDIVVVNHRRDLRYCVERLQEDVLLHATQPVNFLIYENIHENVGFAKACNRAAGVSGNPILGFLNLDLVVYGDICAPVIKAMACADIVGENFKKHPWTVKAWGLRNWVCGAAMFMPRSVWAFLNGFDEHFVWSHEETDLCRRAEGVGLEVRAISLPIRHLRILDRPVDEEYKRIHYEAARRVYSEKWDVNA